MAVASPFASISTCVASPPTLAQVKSACITGEDISDSSAARRSGADFPENSRASPQIIPADMPSAPLLASDRNLDVFGIDAQHSSFGRNASALHEPS